METKKKLSIVNLDNYVSPVIKENPSFEWVTYGKKNSFFQYLIDRSRGSATNSAAIVTDGLDAASSRWATTTALPSISKNRAFSPNLLSNPHTKHMWLLGCLFSTFLDMRLS